MKKMFLSLLAVGLIAGCLSQTGCKSVQTVTTDPNGNVVTNAVVVFDPIAAQATISGIAELGVYLAVQQDPSTAAYFKLAVVTLNGLANANTFDPAAIEKALNDLAIKELKNPYAIVGVRAALIFYKNAFSTVVSEKLDQVQNLKPMLLALSGGISSGLSGFNVEIKYNLPHR
jgi:hypothetical protein